MGKRVTGRTAAGIAVAITLFISGTVSGQDIDLPFDWFYGRWVDGHQPEMDFVWHEYRKPSREGSYRFTSGNYMFGAYDIRGELVSYDGDGHLEFPTLFLRVRPRPNWQLGIDAVTYEAWDYDQTGPHHVTSSRSTWFTGILSSNWINRDSVAVDEDHAAYSYLVSPVTEAGTVRLDNSVYFRIESSHQARLRGDTTHGFYNYGTQRTWCQVTNDFRWSCNDWLDVGGELILATSNDLESFAGYNWPEPYAWPSASGETRNRPLALVYEAEALVIGFAPLYGNISIGQELVESDRHSWRIRDNITGSPFEWDSTTSIPLSESATNYSIGVDYVGRGAFDPNVIRDDYPRYIGPEDLSGIPSEAYYEPGFYDRMLAGRQLWIHSQFDYDRFDLSSGIERRRLTYELGVSYGVTSKVELSISWAYEHSKDSREGIDNSHYKLYATTELGLRVRSFDYQAGLGPGWDRDTPDDIAFGPILQAGMWQAEVTFDPPVLTRRSTDRINFGSVSDLENMHRSSLSVSLDGGLGRGVEMRAFDVEQFRSGEAYRRQYGAALAVRFRGLQFALEYSQIAIRELDYYARGNYGVTGSYDYSYPIFSLNIRALL